MDERKFLDALQKASNTQQVEAALNAYLTANLATSGFQPVGRRPNNRGAIEVASDAGRSIIERVTNMLDAILELEHEQHEGIPICRSPREAASAWLGVPEKEGLSALTNKQRQDLAGMAVVRLQPGEGSQSRHITVIDKGIGIAPDHLETTILSLSGSNKIQKHYLAGTYGQGGSSTFAFCKYTVIISRRAGYNRIGFTLVKYEDLPAEEFKTGRYVFLVNNNTPLETPAIDIDIERGTIVHHFGYDLTGYTSALGSKSIYGMLGRIMFDPVSAIRFENQVHSWNRTIKGARNALNGAVDEGDDDAKGPSLDHYVRMFNVDLGDHGSIGIEYWVLSRPDVVTGRRRTKPTENFVDATKPVVLSHNGQNQGEITGRIIKDAKDGADLPFLQTQGRLICHINCDRLSPNAKRMLFSSTREQSREGYMLERIKSELVGALKADDELVRLNEEAREQSLKEKDEHARKNMRREVAKLLHIDGAALQEAGGTKGSKDGGGEVRQRSLRAKPLPIEPKEPPTFIRIVWDDDGEIAFYTGQRRYIRVETDANSDYHDADNASASRLNIAVGNDLRVFGTSPLKGGRMRIGVECLQNVVIGSTGSIRVELYRKGLPALNDEREYKVIEPPEPKDSGPRSSFPDFEVIPVPGPQDSDWEYICDDVNDTNVSRHATKSVMNDGKLYVYYSEAFPRFANEVKRFEQQNEALGSSFRSRYETWLAVHALLMYQATENEQVPDLPEAVTEEMGRQERVRLAIIAAMVAAREVKNGLSEINEDESATA